MAKPAKPADQPLTQTADQPQSQPLETSQTLPANQPPVTPVDQPQQTPLAETPKPFEDALTGQTAQADTAPAPEPETPQEGAFLIFLHGVLQTAEDAEEIETLKQLIAVVEANPGRDSEFIQGFIGVVTEQVRARKKALYDAVQTIATIDPSTQMLDETEDVDERAERLRGNAQAELDQLKEASLARQALAETEAAERKPPEARRRREDS